MRHIYESYRSVMEFGEEPSPAMAFEKEAFDLTVEDVYDISYVIGRDLLKISSTGEEVSDLQFRIVRVLEMFETLVNKYNLSLEELKMERDNLKSELDRIVKESSSGQGTVSVTGFPQTRTVKDVVRNAWTLRVAFPVCHQSKQRDPTSWWWT